MAEKKDLEELGRKTLERRKQQAEASAARRKKLKAEGKTSLTLTVPIARIEAIKKLVASFALAEPGETVALHVSREKQWVQLEKLVAK